MREKSWNKMEEPKKESAVKFRRYASIIGSASDLLMQSLILEGWTEDKHEWVGTEKIHGANFSFCTDGETVSCSKRTSMLIEGEKFYDWPLVLEREREKVQKVFELAKKEFPDAPVVTIFGELFGGTYPHSEVPRDPTVGVHVQKGVYYCPDIKFYAFDVWVGGQSFLAFDKFSSLCEEAGFLYSKPIVRGTFKELIKFDVDNFVTTLPAIFGLPPIENNIAEGLVLKLAGCNAFTGKGSRVIVKLKSERFKEVSGLKNFNAGKDKPKVANVSGPPIPEFLAEHVERLFCYITTARLQNVLSKFGPDVTANDRGKLAGLLAKDALSDYADDTPAWTELKKEDQKLVTQRLNGFSTRLVTENFSAILNHEF